MPLDWNEVKSHYASGGTLTLPSSTRRLEVAAVDDAGVQLRSSIWTKGVARENLEEAVRLIESGEMSRRLGDFVEQYGKRVTTERRTLTAHVLKDLGYLD